MSYEFTIAPFPRIIFGEGTFKQTAQELLKLGQHPLIITGHQSFKGSQQWQLLLQEFSAHHITWQHASIQGEPSPQQIDHIVSQYHHQNIDVVLGIGGGSVLDAAKAIAGMLPYGNSVMDHLEGVGNGISYPGNPLPLIAIPTTAGTGSEATKNAVLSSRSNNGFKKSFRHDSLIANITIIDPELLHSCPKTLIAANGMDAFVQLLESYVSKSSNPISDALAWSGLEAFQQSFMKVWNQQASNNDYAGIAYASLISGITLAQTGLGSIHALASPIGAYSNMPHGEVCGTLLATATTMNIERLKKNNSNPVALQKYIRVGKLFVNNSSLNDGETLDQFTHLLNQWVESLNLPRLSAYQITSKNLHKIIQNMGSMQNNPVEIELSDLEKILTSRL